MAISPKSTEGRHCEERSDEAIHLPARCLSLDCFGLLRSPRNDEERR
jgi:hypothetical protein